MKNNLPDAKIISPLLKRYEPEARPYCRASILLSCLNGVTIIGGAWVLSLIVNDIAFHKVSLDAVETNLLILGAIYLVRSVLTAMAERFSFLGGAEVRKAVRHDMIAGLLDRGPSGLVKDASGKIINAYVEGVEALQGYYALTLPSRITAAIIPLGIFMAILPMDWWSGLVLLVTAPLIPVFMIWIGKGADSLNRQQWQRMSYMSGHFLDVIQGLSTLKLFNASRRESKILRRISEDFRHDTMAVLRIAFLSSLALEFFATVSIAMIAVMIGFHLLWGQMGFQSGFFVLLLAPEFYLPLRRMGTHYHAKMEALAAAETIDPFIARGSTEKNKLNAIPQGAVSIEFENICFSYPDGEPLLQSLNFIIQKGERIALAGPSGAGKSTILGLLLGFLEPQSGRILINGIDLSTFNMDHWRQSISWLPQRPHLFPGLIKENLLIANSEAISRSDALIRDCGIESFANQMIGESGAGISGGQMQRVALARALMRNSGLLLLDEPTAHLDAETERMAHDAIAKYAPGATVLFAAHRSASLSWADRVININSSLSAVDGRRVA